MNEFISTTLAVTGILLGVLVLLYLLGSMLVGFVFACLGSFQRVAERRRDESNLEERSNQTLDNNVEVRERSTA